MVSSIEILMIVYGSKLNQLQESASYKTLEH